jgi:hypothetical protein
VLSAVLIITAFLAIIAGALGTEISTNFLLSNALVNRVKTEATVNSAVELAISQLQNTSLNQPCPSLGSYTVNQQTAAVSYQSCALVPDRRSPQFARFAASSQFTVDGTLAQPSGLNDYVVGDAGGTVYDFVYGNSTPRWAIGLGGSVTGPPLVMPDPDNSGQFLDLIPLSGPGCAPSTFCVKVVSDNGVSNQSTRCAMPTASAVVSRPAVSKGFSNIAFFGDTSGNIYAFDSSSAADGDCTAFMTASVTNRVVAGPVVFACNGCGRGTDEVFILTSSGGSSSLVRLTYTSSNGLSNPVGTPLNFPWGPPSGIAVESNTLPTRLAISFAAGQVDLVQLSSSGGMSQAASPITLPTAISRAPYWCHCPGLGNAIGIGGGNGTLYVLDTNLNIYSSYAGGKAIDTTPVADGAGDWYFGANDGRIYEVQKPGGGSAMIAAASFGTAGAAFGSSPVIGACPAGICIYVGSLDASAYLVPLDARNAVLIACISTAPPNCAVGSNPRLWTRVEVGDAASGQTVHVQEWSYYSP